ncbi:MAG: site-2 protease family protein [Anaerolineales bacterium]|nr:site-2 protease family protein [Anaerolineales bacterium]
MSWSVKLFRIRGIDIKVHLTFVLILVWAAYRWSAITGEGIQGALFGVVAILLLFVAVTLHELGHSFQALKFGVKVRDITLMPMGGLARLEEMPDKPEQELRIAIAGPLVNFAIVAVLFALGVLLQTRAVISLQELYTSLGQVSWNGMLAYLTMANLVIGVFNLIPAYPMDGGRILRALLAMKIDYGKATSIAVSVGQGLALLLGLWGFMSGTWTLVLIAILVWMGASHEGRHVEAKSVLQEFKVNQAMTRQPLTLKTDDTLARAVELTLSNAQADFPVVKDDKGELVGFLTEANLVKGLQAHGGNFQVGEMMQTDVFTTDVDEPLFTVQQRMASKRVQAAPVVDRDGRLVGLLTTTDINQAYQLLSVHPQLAPQASTS